MVYFNVKCLQFLGVLSSLIASVYTDDDIASGEGLVVRVGETSTEDTEPDPRPFCNTTSRTGYKAYNLGNYLNVVTDRLVKIESDDPQRYRCWQYNDITQTLQSSKFPFWDKYFNVFQFSISFTFGFDVCNNDSEYCLHFEKLKNLVILVGGNTDGDSKPQKAPTGPVPYVSFRADMSGSSFPEVKPDDMPYGWPPTGPDISKTDIFPPLTEGTEYFGAVFNPLKKAMFIVVKNKSKFDLKSRKLLNTGVWGNWESLRNEVGVRDLFMLNSTLYGIGRTGVDVIEFRSDWTYMRKGNIKQFFNCKNSSIISIPVTKTTIFESHESGADKEFFDISITDGEVIDHQMYGNSSIAPASDREKRTNPMKYVVIAVIVIIMVLILSLILVFWFHSAKEDRAVDPADRVVANEVSYS